ncbi:MAG: sugar phosphate isomerase/epimerase [Thermoguttaceae bacterium]|jgi:sugar phosphate isomerase/epimerase|nr:sugar phosphate isomerase/epimerase [Thermoguttaceae bacterium]
MMTPTLFSVSYAGLWGQARLTVTEFLMKAASLGYPAVELMGKRPHLSVLDTDDRQVEEIRRVATTAGVEIATVAGYTNFTMGRDTEVPSVEIQVAYVRSLAQLARRLGAKIVRIFTGYATEPEGAARDWDLCVRAVRECAAVAADCGVVLGVQNHHDVGVGVDAYLEFLDDVGHPNCRAMFDPWAPALHGEDLRTAARRLAPRMIQTTLADYVRLPRYVYLPGLVNYRRLDDMTRAVPLGEGFLDLEGFFAGLREGGFEGYVAYEMCSPLRGGGSVENLDRAAARSLAKINEWTRA